LNVLAGRVPAAKRNKLEGVVAVGETSLVDFDTQVFGTKHIQTDARWDAT